MVVFVVEEVVVVVVVVVGGMVMVMMMMVISLKDSFWDTYTDCLARPGTPRRTPRVPHPAGQQPPKPTPGYSPLPPYHTRLSGRRGLCHFQAHLRCGFEPPCRDEPLHVPHQRLERDGPGGGEP
jgi:hypothetical protein